MPTHTENLNLTDILRDKTLKQEVAETLASFIKVLQDIKRDMAAEVNTQVDTKVKSTVSKVTGQQRRLVASISTLENKLKSELAKLTGDNKKFNDLRDKLYNELSFDVERLKSVKPKDWAEEIAKLEAKIESKIGVLGASVKGIPSFDDRGILDRLEHLQSEVDRFKNTVFSKATVGGSRPTTILNNGTVVSGHITRFNFVNPSAMTAIGANQRQVDITFPTSAGSVETPVGDIDSVNVTYTVSNTPSRIVSDGQTYFDGAGYTLATLTITMDVAPSQYIRSIF